MDTVDTVHVVGSVEVIHCSPVYKEVPATKNIKCYAPVVQGVFYVVLPDVTRQLI